MSKRCESEQYKRDEGYFKCELNKGHKGAHKCMIKFWWEND